MNNIKHILFTLLFGIFPLVGLTQEASIFINTALNINDFNASNIQWRITSEHTSSTSDIHHVYFQQVIEGILIRGTESSVHISSLGELLFESNQFIDEVSEITINKSLIISPIEAVESVVRQMNYVQKSAFEVIEDKKTSDKAVVVNNGGISQREIPVKLVIVKSDKNEYVLAWEMSILELDFQHSWVIHVNAQNGAIIKKEDRTRTCYSHNHENEVLDYHKNLFNIENFDEFETKATIACEECYEVFAIPLESPYYGNRSVVENAADPLASPYGWHDTDGVPGPEYQVTNGNNANAYEANDNFGYQPDGGLSLDFTGYTFDQEYNQNFQYEDASITNLFYWTNIIHDITYRHGFTEAAGNFQTNNYDRGGKANDAVLALGQSITRPCNGSFSTNIDGIAPILIINLCENKDGDFDTTVIAHEYGHGYTERLVGGGVVVNCLQNKENPSEGYCDWLGMILTIKPEDTGVTPRPIATYLLGQGPNGNGVRIYPYSTDMNINPSTYEDVALRFGRHKIGAIWGEIIWEMTWSLIDEFGFDPNLYNFTGDLSQDAGNIMAMAIVTEGLKFTPCRPGFVDARDGIIMAAQEIYGRRVICVIWEAFAKRGIGYFADQGSAESQLDQTVSFETPVAEPSFKVEDDTFCLESGIHENISGGFPVGGNYFGPGVIDNGDGRTFNFDPVLAGPGVHTITYNAPAWICSPAGEVSIEITVKEDNLPPQIECLHDVSLSLTIVEFYYLPDFTVHIITSDNCPGFMYLTQTPSVGTLINSSGDTEITITARDVAGNESSCTFLLTISFNSENQIEPEQGLTFYPNPSGGELTVFNPKEKKINTIEIRDMQGRYISQILINNSERENNVSVETLASGVYFITVSLANEIKVLRLIKR